MGWITAYDIGKEQIDVEEAIEGMKILMCLGLFLNGFLFISIIMILHSYFGFHGIIWSMTVTELLTFFIGIVLFMKFERTPVISIVG
jgi:hypothetical protein